MATQVEVLPLILMEMCMRDSFMRVVDMEKVHISTTLRARRKKATMELK